MCTQNEIFRSFSEALLSDLESAGLSPAVVRLRNRYAKRFVCDDAESMHSEALKSFVDTNNSVIPPNIGAIDPVIIGEAQRFIYNALCKFTWSYSDVRQCELDWTLLFDLWKFGPGTSNNGTRATHFCDKIWKRMTCTQKALPLVRMLRSLSPRIKASDLAHPDLGGIKIIQGSRLSSAPKNQEVRRTVAIEPSGNMALQLAAAAYIEGALRRIGIDITTQEAKNKHLAFLGSLDGLLCTIDLRSASDLISIALIKLLWPQSWFELFMTIRSPECKVGQNMIALNMMSTMGNGFTFPMMTLTLAALIFGYQRSIGSLNGFRLDYNTSGVYGDDVIVPTEHFVGITKLFADCGLSVNYDKSFSDGPFRESCGGDYHNGVDITPFYVESLNNDNEVYVAINKSLLWMSKHNIVMPRLLKFFSSLLSTRYTVPEWEDPSQGILSMFPPRRYKMLEIRLKPSFRKITEDLHYMCVLGGYASVIEKKGRGDYLTYVRRDAERTHVVKNARLPKGYLDGHDPQYGCRDLAMFRSRLIAIFLA